jgi:hypothetical protein
LDIFLDYVTFLHPDLKERLHNLSDLLPRILQNGLPPEMLVFETYSADRLSEIHDRSLNELFQFATSEDSRRVDTMVESRSDQMNTAGSSALSMASFEADDEHPMDGEAQSHSCVPQTTPQGQPYQAEESGGRPDPSISESLESQSAGSPAINLRPREWQPMDPIESVASRSSLAEPLSVRSVSEASPADMASEDMSVDMYPHHDPSQSAFPAVLHGTPPTPTMQPGLVANYLTWDSNRGADTRFHDPVQVSNLDNIYLSSPIVSPTLPPLPQTTADDVVLHDQSYPYSAPFFL